MAEKKTTKAPAKRDAKKAPEVKTMEDLRNDLVKLQNDLLEAKRSHAARELVNPMVLRITGREIARVKTAIRENELKEKKNG